MSSENTSEWSAARSDARSATHLQGQISRIRESVTVVGKNFDKAKELYATPFSSLEMYGVLRRDDAERARRETLPPCSRSSP